jgi:class 3 adenylate cyclase
VQTVAVVDPGDVRIGDDDRQAVIDLLRRHTGEGRLTLDEFADRAGQVFASRTRGELDEVLAGLPSDPQPILQPEGPVGREAGAPERRRRFVAIMCGSRARGRWRAPREVSAFAFWGSVCIDLRHAVIDGPSVDISACAIMGGVEVIVPEGIPVELDGMVLMGGATNRTRATDPLPDAPVVRVHARGLWGGVTARTRRSKSGGDLADKVTEAQEAANDWIRSRSIPVSPLPPPVPPMPAVGHRSRDADAHKHGNARGQRTALGQRGPRGPGAGGPVVDVRDFLPRFLTDDSSGRPDRAESGAGATRLPMGTLTILVTDMAGSTTLAEELGDRRWWQVLQAHNTLVRDEVQAHGGTEVKAQGDGFLVVFPSARDAIRAGVAIQCALASYRDEHPEHPVEVRIGLHTGETVEADGDVFGQNVIAAVRIADAAAPGEVLVSSLTRDLTAAGGDLRFDDGEDVTLKGLSQPWRVHRVLWD